MVVIFVSLAVVDPRLELSWLKAKASFDQPSGVSAERAPPALPLVPGHARLVDALGRLLLGQAAGFLAHPPQGVTKRHVT